MSFCQLRAQKSNLCTQNLNIGYNQAYEGFHRLDLEGYRLFFLGETQHLLLKTPALTIKLLTYLHQYASTRIWAIEQGHSAAFLINKYLDRPDSALLRQIARNTLFWGKESIEALVQLSIYNRKLPPHQKIIVKGIDVEYKPAPAILMFNMLMAGKPIPESLMPTLGQIRQIFEDTRAHREQYEALMVHFYYDKVKFTDIVSRTYAHWKASPAMYKSYFGHDYHHFEQSLEGLMAGFIRYDYSKPTRKIKARDQFIYDALAKIGEAHPNKGVLCVIGSGHLLRNTSGDWLRRSASSPYQGKTLNLFLHAPFGSKLKPYRIKKANNLLSGILLNQPATLIENKEGCQVFGSLNWHADYYVFLNDGRYYTSFSNAFNDENNPKR